MDQFVVNNLPVAMDTNNFNENLGMENQSTFDQIQPEASGSHTEMISNVITSTNCIQQGQLDLTGGGEQYFDQTQQVYEQQEQDDLVQKVVPYLSGQSKQDESIDGARDTKDPFSNCEKIDPLDTEQRSDDYDSLQNISLQPSLSTEYEQQSSVKPGCISVSMTANNYSMGSELAEAGSSRQCNVIKDSDDDDDDDDIPARPIRKSRQLVLEDSDEEAIVEEVMEDILFELIDKNNHKCDYCRKSFSTNRGLHIHMSTHKSRLSFKCSQCKDRFRSQAQLDKHQKSFHHSVKEERPKERPQKRKERPKHVCKTCRKVFDSKDRLSRHKQKHEDEPSNIMYVFLNKGDKVPMKIKFV